MSPWTMYDIYNKTTFNFDYKRQFWFKNAYFILYISIFCYGVELKSATY